MDTNVQALKNLYEQLGGDPADVANISTNADTINAIAGLDIGGGGDVDQTYDATSENAQSGTAVAEALETIPSVTVDQTFDATSANAQSGVAVAQAVGAQKSIGTSAVTDYLAIDWNSTNAQEFTNVSGKTIANNKVYQCDIELSVGGQFIHADFFFALNRSSMYYYHRLEVNNVYVCDLAFRISENKLSVTVMNKQSTTPTSSSITIYELMTA